MNRLLRLVISAVLLGVSGLGCIVAAVTPSTTPASAAVPNTRAAAERAAVHPGPELEAFRRAIRERYALKERAFAAHDANTIVEQFYTDDVISVGEGEGIYVGRESIRPLYAEVVKSNLVKIDSVYSYVQGRAGWDWADFHVTPTDGKTQPFTFAILFLWTKIGERWWCKGDFFVNGSLREGKLAPPQPGAP